MIRRILIVIDNTVPTGAKKWQHAEEAIRRVENRRKGVLRVTPENATEFAHVMERLANLHIPADNTKDMQTWCPTCGASPSTAG